MASLKEVKTRIGSVRTTRKITSARGMVASAKLHRAQGALEGARAYREGLMALWARFSGVARPVVDDEVPKKPLPTAVIALGSDAGMAGAFNTLIERELEQTPAGAQRYAVGRKIGGTLPAEQVWAEVMALWESGRIAGVELIYHDFQSMAHQPVVRQTLLPLDVTPQASQPTTTLEEWIVEPSPGAVVEQIEALLVGADFRAAVASSIASEHVARMMAMQAATDNADELLDELQLSYNKLRQQNITSELLDIIGSSFA